MRHSGAEGKRIMEADSSCSAAMALVFFLMAFPAYAVTPAQSAPKAPVKLTTSKICHGVDSPWYARIKRPVKTFKTMADCLATGAREPKRKKAKGGSK